ncbi:hypothetical protein MLD38_030983 [Melastoma candidum]|uniref:Uncharacterized protein n=1 Tax=Melastoma candidum TaxID=119954 RepID=A0ACB9MPK2_9MYRT|nr:hypothetical protein MLD38_030983 [Melastoma candidum]
MNVLEKVMGFPRGLLLFVLIGICCSLDRCSASSNQEAELLVSSSEPTGRPIPSTLFGMFFEEINHAGTGGLWAELVRNRGFEAGGPTAPSYIEPWSIIGNRTYLDVGTDRSSLFERNKVALRMEVLCDSTGDNICPAGGVGVYNPGFWGMNIQQGKTYDVVFYVRSSGAINLTVSLTGSSGSSLASTIVLVSDSDGSKWSKVNFQLQAKDTDTNSRLQLTTSSKGVIWLDQVSVMPSDTYKGHGFRTDLMEMLLGLKPRFLRFPGGCFVEGAKLRNAFRWKETVGPWEERPGHFGDVWNYWTDDALGHYEFFQLAEDLGAIPVWVFNNGIAHDETVETPLIAPFVQEALDGIEFARGSASSQWGSLRAKMGHPEPFDLRYVAVGNEDCWKPDYRGKYMKFYQAIKNAYPDMQIISNCDGSSTKLDHPADLYDYHIYSSANGVFSDRHHFDQTSRSGPKAFVSEYAVWKEDAGLGSLLASLAEAAFLLGIEKNSDTVLMASYAPLFANKNDWNWKPDAIVFDSSRVYGTPSYWMQHFFVDSSGGTLLDSNLTSSSSSIVASAISYVSQEDKKSYIKIKVVNFGSETINLTISISGLDQNSIQSSGSFRTALTSTNVMDENSFSNPNKVVPIKTLLESAGKDMEVTLPPHSFNSFDLLKEQSSMIARRSDRSSVPRVDVENAVKSSAYLLEGA